MIEDINMILEDANLVQDYMKALHKEDTFIASRIGSIIVNLKKIKHEYQHSTGKKPVNKVH